MSERLAGLLLFVVSVPTFFAVREGPIRHASARTRRIVNTSCFLAGALGMGLILFGGVGRALLALSVWTLIAWLYNL